MSRIHSSPPFARKRAVRAILASMFVALSPANALAEAARVTFAHGAVAATAADGARRALSRGADIDAGETINTGRGRAQLRFTDGSFVSLQPNTEFRVDEYAFKDKEEPQQRGFFSLLRGGLRTITGLIGRTRKAGYRMRTSVATIGIRGTEYSLNFDGERLSWSVADDGKSSISVVLGNGLEQIISSGGSGSATAEEFQALVTALQQLADVGELQDGVSAEKLFEIFTAAGLVPPNPPPPVVDPDPDPDPVVPPPDCATAMPSCTIAAAFGALHDEIEIGLLEVSGVHTDGGEGNLAAVFNADGGLRSFSTSFPGIHFEAIAVDGAEGTTFPWGGLSQAADADTAQVVVDGRAYFSVDPANPLDARTTATWGRWIAPPGGGKSDGSRPHPLQFRDGENDTFAYVVSIPPPETYNMGAATYDLAGFTPPAVVGGGAVLLGAPGAVTGSLTVSFSNAQVTGLNMNVPFANGSYGLSASGMPMFNGTSFTGVGKPFFAGGVSVTGTGAACADTACSGLVSGNVFGPRADGAALGYHIYDADLSKSGITGAAVFQQKSCTDCAVVPVP